MRAARALLAAAFCAAAFPAAAGPGPDGAAMPVDLPDALRLADARNIDIEIARERLREAEANRKVALEGFLPSLSAGIGFRGHNGKTQRVEGDIIDAYKYSYAPGATLSARWELGETWFAALAARQIRDAEGHALEARRQETVMAAAAGYFDLALASGAAAVAADALELATDYEAQVARAVEAGVALKSDVFRARVQRENNALALRQAREAEQIASARLVQVLRLDPAVRLVAAKGALAPLDLAPSGDLPALLARAAGSRPERKQSDALALAASKSAKAAIYGPLVPSVEISATGGGFGGGRYERDEQFGGQADYFVGAGWRIGPGGLLDFPRIDAAKARRRQAELSAEKAGDEIARQVVEARARCASLREQIGLAESALAAAKEGFDLARSRKEFGVAAVLETIAAERDFTDARNRYLQAVAESNKAQYGLKRAVSDL